MTRYESVQGDRELFTMSKGQIGISKTANSHYSLTFTPKPEDFPLIALDLLDSVKPESPDRVVGPELKADSSLADDALIYTAWRNLEAVRIRRARRAEEARLEADALALYKIVTEQSTKTEFFGDGVRTNWINKLKKLRKEITD